MGEMEPKSDAQLLYDFARNGDDDGFREIVTRHTNFVYSAALRQVESSAAAADITQSVFTDLARKASKLTRDFDPSTARSLASWLCCATRYATLRHLRDSRRHLDKERQAMEQLITNLGSDADWEQIRLLLDEGLDRLGEQDREAVLLRYFHNQDFRAVGRALGVSDDAAQKRVSRALERLREFFSKRRVSIGTSGLAVLLAANSVQSAPTGLASTISATALLAGSAVFSFSTGTITMTTLQKTIVAVAITTLTGAAIYETRYASRLHI